MNKTQEQQDILDHVGTKNHFVAKARAGCSKTTTGKLIAQSRKNKKIRFVAFTNANTDDLKRSMPSNVDCSTWNSYGARCLKERVPLNKFKMSNIITRDEEYNSRGFGIDRERIQAIKENHDSMVQLCNLMRNTSIDPTQEEVQFFLDNYDMTFSLPANKVISDCIGFVRDADSQTKEIDFIDQVRFPVLSNSLRADVDMFLADEHQDSPKLRILALKQLAAKGVQIGAFGDELQSIYGFAGAYGKAMEETEEILGNVFPLTINFRCGKNIIREVQKTVPDIQYWEGSPEGEVRSMDNKLFEENFKDGDVALSRFNKIIIPICFKMIRQGKKCTIQGRDFGEQLKKMVKEFKATSIDQFYTKITKWFERQTKHISEDSSAFDAVFDKFDCLKFFADQCETVEEIYQRIDDIFNDAIVGHKLSTAHKSKGLEWSRVFLLDSAKFMMSKPNMTAMQISQERNLKYVGQTRAKELLVYVN